MDKGLKLLNTYFADESGATAIEYGLIAALIGASIISGLSALGGGAGGAWNNMSESVTGALEP